MAIPPRPRADAAVRKLCETSFVHTVESSEAEFNERGTRMGARPKLAATDHGVPTLATAHNAGRLVQC